MQCQTVETGTEGNSNEDVYKRQVLSELIRTAFIPKEGCRFIVADFSALEARVLAWLSGGDVYKRQEI